MKILLVSHVISILIIFNSILVNELKKYIDADSLTEDSSQPNSLDVSFDGKPKIKSPRDQTKPRKKSSPLRKLSNESQKLPSRPSTESESSEKKKFKQNSKFKSHKKDNQQQAPVVQRKLNLDKSAKKLGQNRSHSATNLHKISVKDYHGSFQLRRTSTSGM